MKTSSIFSEIKCNEAQGGNKTVPTQIQIARVGNFSHPEYGSFSITPTTLSDFKKNFEQRVRRVDLAVDYFHENENIAAGWFKELSLSDDGTALFATIDWTPKGAQMLADRELRYFSPEFVFKYQDPETKAITENVLLGGGLTNRPHIKEMLPVVASENGGNVTELEQVKADLAKTVKKLSETETQLADAKKAAEGAVAPTEIEALKTQLADLAKKIEELSNANKALSDDKAKLEEEKKMSEKEKSFNVLLSEGKACAAQKEAYMKGDFEAYAKLAGQVNLSEKGNGGEGDKGGNKTETAADKVMKLAETKVKEKGIKLSEAISETLRENKELKAEYEKQ